MSGAFLIQLLVSLGIIAIIYLAGLWFLRILELGDPWPKILLIVVAILILTSIIAPLLGYGRFWFPAVSGP